jgi:uncharacterized membrane protein
VPEQTTGDYPPAGRSESHWPARLSVLIAIVLQVLLPDQLHAGPRWLLPVLEGVMLIALVVVSPQRVEGPHSLRRELTLTTTAVVSVANSISLVLLAHLLLNGRLTRHAGHPLIIAGAMIWLTNVMIFSLWYWELDRGGPGLRAAGLDQEPDFLFPQMSDTKFFAGWRPMFLDYMYVSLTNSSAFSPTDTMPLTVGAKMVMGVQALVSLITVGLVVARAVNIL